MTQAFKVKLDVDQGATFRKTQVWQTEATPGVRTPVDLTGCTARMQIRKEIATPTPYITLTTENGGIILGGLAGTVTIVMTDTETAAFNWAVAVYDLEIVLLNGDVRRLMYGSVVVNKEVTRD